MIHTQPLFKTFRFRWSVILWSMLLAWAGDALPAQPLADVANADFVVKGFHIDLRTEVMTMKALKQTAADLAASGINTIVMEWEATYPYQQHATISNRYAYTRQEVTDFVQYCHGLGIDVIPLQQCFGHMEYILRHDRYAALKEDKQEISQLCPLKTDLARTLFADLFADMAAMHGSRYIHIGGDETYLLGHCEACQKKVATEGKSRLYLDYIREMCGLVIAMGKVPVLWADIALKYPEAIAALPQEAILVDWNYGWDTNYFGNVDKIRTRGITMWGSPAIRSHPDNWYLTCWEKHFNNQRDFIPYARQAGYQGIVMTSWSTSGLYGFTWDIGWEVVDLQPIRNVYPLSGFSILLAAYGAAVNSTKPLDPEAFVTSYAQSRFGLSASEGHTLWQVLTTAPDVIVHGQTPNGTPVQQLRDSLAHAQQLIQSLKPTQNQREFAHLQLMTDLRKFYLDGKVCEAQYESDTFNRNQAPALVAQVTKLVQAGKALDKRFTALQKGFLLDEEIEKQNSLRHEKLSILYARLQALVKEDASRR